MSMRNLEREIRWLLAEKYNGEKTLEAERDIERLKKGEHVAYVIGFVDFSGCRIDLSERPLIPRLETEFWVGKVIERLKRRPRSPRCLDIFAGSGCVGIAILRHISETSVDFAEKDARFLDQIKINLEKNEIPPERARIIESDVFSGIQRRYNLILANPPYIAESRRDSVEVSVLQNEPREALFAPDHGLFYIKELIKEAPEYLEAGGECYFEFDTPQLEEIKNLLEESKFRETEILKDQYGEWRWARAKLLG